ncbi:MAG: hypothetical protein PVF73_02820 [Bacteroidales bacterium]|jgi:hypothetical protein
MYTSYIGLKFLKIYNEKKGTNYNAEDFFNEIIFPLFFNDDKHFLNVANSSFFQSVSQKLMEEGKSIHQIKLERFHKNVKEDGASLTTMVGYAAQGIMAGTSGQLTSMDYAIDENEMYASWIGVGLSISMGGGFSILLDKPEVIEVLFKGWQFYRDLLSQTPNLKGNQIDVWNSYWLSHAFSKNFDEDNPLDDFHIPDPVPCKSAKWKAMGLIEFEANKWSKVVFALSRKYPHETITANAFKFADMNVTLGFINFYLPQVVKFHELKEKILIPKESIVLQEEEIESLTTYFSFKGACRMGTIGLKALEPDKLREYMPEPIGENKEYKFTNEESYKQYQLFKLWITAMINKTELLESATKMAAILVEIENQQVETGRGKTEVSQKSKEFLNVRNLKEFTDGLTEMLGEISEKEAIRNTLVEVLRMPLDLFPLFITLIKFEYNYLKKN